LAQSDGPGGPTILQNKFVPAALIGNEFGL
jgi:hypothetical protein